MRKVVKISAIIAANLLFIASAHAATIDLVSNGYFEAGNIGFNSEHTFVTSNSPAGQYTVGTDPKAFNGNFSSFGDKTSGSGNMMIINGSTSVGTVAWEQTVGVTAGQTYEFSIWIANAFTSGNSLLDLVANGVNVGSANTTQGVTGVWEQFSGSWTASTSGNIAIQLIENSTAFGGNDYALDDISFTTDMSAATPVPLPASAWLLITGLAGVFGLSRKRRA
ncbi:VPLPA-CTERM sorting domain-containing protein [uncultured Roseibium sp.]|uniref:VPLPA-CTERM sorting domain-containing protein n=1 Tax=uncultured Roseibium sp. TaxID=1936171 RepID=UPI002636E414|nr:VPLPA-CTERM sorting domain-containing protein [uncultured Roseibium sp.]